MTTLQEAYEDYKSKEPYATIIEPQCLKTGCEGDIYRARIAALEKQIKQDHDNYADWQHRAETAEKQLTDVMEAIRNKMIYKPTDHWQWGYRSALFAILDVIKPESELFK
jgi:hypothetical protein